MPGEHQTFRPRPTLGKTRFYITPKIFQAKESEDPIKCHSCFQRNVYFESVSYVSVLTVGL